MGMASGRAGGGGLKSIMFPDTAFNLYSYFCHFCKHDLFSVLPTHARLISQSLFPVVVICAGIISTTRVSRTELTYQLFHRLCTADSAIVRRFIPCCSVLVAFCPDTKSQGHGTQVKATAVKNQ